MPAKSQNIPVVATDAMLNWRTSSAGTRRAPKGLSHDISHPSYAYAYVVVIRGRDDVVRGNCAHINELAKRATCEVRAEVFA